MTKNGKAVEPVAVLPELEDTAPSKEPETVSLDGLTVEAALVMLRALRVTGGPVILTATLADPRDTAVVDGHAYSGQWVGGQWRFDGRALDMACRVAGWSKVERDGARWRLS